MTEERINIKALQDAIAIVKSNLDDKDVILQKFYKANEDYSDIRDTFSRYKAMVDDAISLYEQAKDLASISDPGLKGSISRKAEPFQKGNFTMAVIGKMSAGKSTFINAFLRNQNLLPTGHLQTTCTLTTIKHSEQKKLSVLFGDKHEKEYLEDFEQELKNLVSVPDDFQDLPVNFINSLILDGKNEQDILSKSVLSEVAAAMGISNAQIDTNLLRRYVQNHPAGEIPIEVVIECPLPEEYKGWHIVDTPGVGAVGGIEELTKDFLSGSDKDGNHYVDAIIFLYSAKDPVQEKSFNEFVESTLNAISEEARKRSFFVINKASDTGFQANKDAVMKQINNLFVKTGKISQDRIFIVDSLDSLLADDSSLDYCVYTKPNSPVPKSWVGWSENDWKIPKQSINDARIFLMDSDTLEYNNENIRKRLHELSNFSSIREFLSSFVITEKSHAFSSVISYIRNDIERCMEIKQKDLEVLKAGLGQSPEEFQEVFENERKKLDEFQLRANKKFSDLRRTYSKMNTKFRFDAELKKNSFWEQAEKGFLNLSSWDWTEMRREADKLGKIIEAFTESISVELKESIKDFVEANKIELSITLPSIDYDAISSDAKETTATFHYEVVRVIEKSGTWNKVKRFFAGTKKNWGWETKQVQVKDYNDDAAYRTALASLSKQLCQNVEDYKDRFNTELESLILTIDDSIKKAIDSRTSSFVKLEEKAKVLDNIKSTEAETFILKAANQGLDIYNISQ